MTDNMENVISGTNALLDRLIQASQIEPPQACYGISKSDIALFCAGNLTKFQQDKIRHAILESPKFRREFLGILVVITNT